MSSSFSLSPDQSKLWCNLETVSTRPGFPNRNEEGFTKMAQLILDLEVKSKAYLKRASDSLARSVIVLPNGRKILLFNRKKMGDELLGKGHYKLVTAALDLQSGEELATASTRERADKVANFDREIKILEDCREDRNFIQLIGSVKYESKIYSGHEKCRLIFKRYNLRDLGLIIRKGPLLKTLDNRKIIFLRLVEMVAELHRKKMVHRDIKPDNILVHQTNRFEIVFGDVGSLCRETDSARRREKCGTPFYLTPEQATIRHLESTVTATPELNHALCEWWVETASYSSDMWALGVTLFELFKYNYFPWVPPEASKTRGPWLKAMSEIDPNKPLLAKPAENSPLYLVWRMLTPDPKTRITAEEALLEARRLEKEDRFTEESWSQCLKPAETPE